MRIAVGAILLSLLTVFSAPAKSDADAPVRRGVLALYDSRFEASPTDTLIHTNMEMPFNHLGYILRYHDLAQGVPSASQTREAVAVITMFAYDLSQPDAFLGWLETASAGGLRILTMGHFGVPQTEANLRRLNGAMGRIGLRVLPDYVPNTMLSHLLARDGDLVGFERDVDPLPPSHPVVVRAGPEADVALEYETPVLGETKRSIVMATGPGGGYVANGFALSYDEALDVKRWVVDPFEFLARALGHPDFPVPDVTTASGRRIYFSHVDGDGWNNLSSASPDPAKPELSSEVMLDRLIGPYPDLPVSVGLVGSDIDPELGGGAKAAEIARRIYALPQVEVASHTMTHPFRWEFFDPYSRERELAEVGDGQMGARGFAGQIAAYLHLPSSLGGASGGHAHGSQTPPRAFWRDPYDLGAEVGGALQVAESLAPPAKKAAIYLWSGDTQPTEATIRATREAGVRNMNGGDVRFDTHRPSLAYVAPISRTVGAERQIYSGNSNENNYTKLWTDHFYGFRQARETFDRTEAPRRLKGVNVYYHSYSAERQASLEAVLTHLDWARSAHLTPIRASQYAAAADGFFSTRITALGDERWRVENRDGLNTVRFDRAEGREVDMPRSLGVLGWTRHEGSFYVALDAAVPAALVAMRASGSHPASDTPQAQLEDSRWLLRDLRREPCDLGFTAEGFGPGEFTFRDLPAQPLRVRASRAGREIASLTLSPQPQVPTSFVLPAGDPAPVDVSIRCIEGEAEGL